MLLEPAVTPYDVKWRMWGIPTRVHPFFWLGAVLLGWVPRVTFSELVVWTACLFGSILLHEFGHALTAKHFRATGLRVVLYGMGGLAISDGGLTRKQRIIELFMGPGAGFILFGIVYGLSFAVPFNTLPPLVGFALWQLMYINGWWGVINLAPVYPLDGGQIAREWALSKRPNDGVAVSLRISFVAAIAIAVIFLGLGLWAVLEQSTPQWLPVFLFGLLAVVNYQLSRPAALAAEQERGFHERREPWERDPDWWKK